MHQWPKIQSERRARRLQSPRKVRAGLIAFATVALLVLPSGAGAQAVFPEHNGEALKGMESVSAAVLVRDWVDMPDASESFRLAMQREFELGLRRDGIRVENHTGRLLFCKLSFMLLPNDLVVYNVSLELYTGAESGALPLLWMGGGMGRVGWENFSVAGMVRHCVNGFSNEWLKWNPR